MGLWVGGSRAHTLLTPPQKNHVGGGLSRKMGKGGCGRQICVGGRGVGVGEE